MMGALLLTVLMSCSQQDDVWNSDDGGAPGTSATQSVKVKITRADDVTFADAGIRDLCVFAYLSDSLVYADTLSVGDGNLDIPLPLGEKLKTFAVANAGSISDQDSLSTAVIYQDEAMQKDVFLSNIVEFKSDKSVAQVELKLTRVVGQLVFAPQETADELNAISDFDQLSMTFTNVASGYKVQSGDIVLDTLTCASDLKNGFGVSFYSFPTSKAAEKTNMDVAYLKGGVEVTRTKKPLDIGVEFKASKRFNVTYPILDELYVNKAVKSVDERYQVTETNF